MNIHAAPLEIRCPPIDFDTIVSKDIGDESFVREASAFAHTLPKQVIKAIIQFRAESHQSGALLLRDLPIGEIPDTPSDPTSLTIKDSVSERTLLAVATLLGEPIGYKSELGGRLVQNLVPTRTNHDRQTSTSSSVSLLFHTETAFHPYRPEYLILLCLRGDPDADTTLSSLREIWPHLSTQTQNVLFEPRFRTSIDESFLNGRENRLGELMSVFRNRENPIMVFDEELMVGTDPEAHGALTELGVATRAIHGCVNLRAGDMLIIDNSRAVHGRSSYTPQFDGKDRWLQRTFVISSLPTNKNYIDNRVVMMPTEFGVY
jgi:alpha-ketoglutarate-dependent taurine dioxygenase